MLTLLILLSLSPPNQAHASGVQVPLPNTSLKYEELEAVSPTEQTFPRALLEMQKIHYRNQQWDRFFAYAVFYRHKFLSNPSQIKKFFIGRFFSLEALALSRHCLWDQALSVAKNGVQIAERLESSDLEEIRQTSLYIQLLHDFPKTKETAKGAKIPSPVFNLANYWPVDEKLIRAISHPKVLRFNIKGRCEK